MEFMKKKKHKGVIADLTNAGLGIVVLAVILAVGLLILIGVRNQSTDATVNTTLNTTISAIGSIPGWLSTIIVVIVGAGLIGLVMVAFMYMRRGGGGGLG